MPPEVRAGLRGGGGFGIRRVRYAGGEWALGLRSIERSHATPLPPTGALLAHHLLDRDWPKAQIPNPNAKHHPAMLLTTSVAGLVTCSCNTTTNPKLCSKIRSCSESHNDLHGGQNVAEHCILVSRPLHKKRRSNSIQSPEAHDLMPSTEPPQTHSYISPSEFTPEQVIMYRGGGGGQRWSGLSGRLQRGRRRISRLVCRNLVRGVAT